MHARVGSSLHLLHGMLLLNVHLLLGHSRHALHVSLDMWLTGHLGLSWHLGLLGHVAWRHLSGLQLSTRRHLSTLLLRGLLLSRALLTLLLWLLLLRLLLLWPFLTRFHLLLRLLLLLCITGWRFSTFLLLLLLQLVLWDQSLLLQQSLKLARIGLVWLLLWLWLLNRDLR